MADYDVQFDWRPWFCTRCKQEGKAHLNGIDFRAAVHGGTHDGVTLEWTLPLEGAQALWKQLDELMTKEPV